MKIPAALLAPLAAVLLLATPAGAHGGEGETEITSVTRDGDDVTVVARVTYVEDGHGVPDATVTVVVDDGTSVPMEAGDEEGDYEVTVPASPGATIRVTSVEPATSAEATAPPAAEASTESTTTTEAEPTTAAPDAGDDEGAATSTPVSDEDVADGGDDGISPVVIGAIGAVVLAAVVAGIIMLGKKPSDDGTDA